MRTEAGPASLPVAPGLHGPPAGDTIRVLDQFYTRPDVAEACWQVVQSIGERLGVDLGRYWFIEPAAGCGCFYQLLPARRRIGVDIEPRQLPDINGNGIVQADYLTWEPPPARRRSSFVVIGNPPFGTRGRLAVHFFNHSRFADIIAFIVPVSFRKFGIQKRLLPQYSLVARSPLDRNSFRTPDGRDYAVNAEFQIWTRLPNSLPNLRETEPAPILHPDFQMRQYNNTLQAMSVFDDPFDFAVPCQGYQDYARRETDPAKCEKNKQWILFVARNDEVRRRLMSMDFATLARESATATPGFRKNDVVRHYASIV